MTNRSIPTAETLNNLYEVIREIINDESVYYSEKEIKALKNNSENIFLKIERGGRHANLHFTTIE